MLTPSGRAFIFILLFSLFICWYTQSRLAYFMSALALSALIVSCVSFGFSMMNIECARSAPASAYEGDSINITVTLKNKGAFREEFIRFSDNFPPETINPHKRFFIEEFPRNNSLIFNYKARCHKRGIYALGPCILTKYDFFGFLKKEIKLYPESKLVVFPRTFRVGFFPLGLRSSTPRYGNMVSRRAGEYEEFYGVREYSKEDGLRKIHWPISVKHNRLMVRHFEQSSSYMGSIIINLKEEDNIGIGHNTTLECSLRIAASVTEYLTGKSGTVQLLAYADKPLLSTFGKSSEHSVRLLETLTGLEANSRMEFSAALTRLSPLIPAGTSLIAFILDRDSESQSLLNSLAVKKNLFVTQIILLSSSFAGLSRPGPDIPRVYREPSGIWKYYIGYGDSLERIFSLRPNLL